MQKLYCYVDETGQDPGVDFFVVVAVVSDKEQDLLRKHLLDIELIAKTGRRKWHKSHYNRRITYLKLVIERNAGKGEVFFGRYKKPLPYFFPILETIKKAISKKAKGDYLAAVYIDGIDKKKAREMTNALRIQGIRLRVVKSKRDESEPLIRLADMWAGCIRGALLERKEEKDILKIAEQKRYLERI